MIQQGISTSGVEISLPGRGSKFAYKKRANKRIALFTGNFFNVTDGVVRTLNRLVSHLEKLEYSVLVFGPTASNRSTYEFSGYVSIPSIPIPGRGEYRLALGLSKSVRQLLDRFDPDIVHIATPDILGVSALKWAHSREKPVVATYHTHFPSYLRYYHLGGLKSLAECYLCWFYKQCWHVYVPTSQLKDYFLERGLNDNIKIWGRGVDCNVFSPGWRSETWRWSRGIGSDEVLLTYVGRLVKEKGLDVFASVVMRLREEGVNFRSMIVGEGPLRSSLESQLPDTIFTGHLEGADLSRAYASSDIFLFPSETEAFGNVIVEAMASGLPVICAGSAPSSSHVHHEVTGLIAPPRDIDTFYEHTRRLILDQELRSSMAARARQRSTMYRWDHTLNELAGYYEEVLAASQTVT